jgi:hypothetical protein
MRNALLRRMGERGEIHHRQLQAYTVPTRGAAGRRQFAKIETIAARPLKRRDVLCTRLKRWRRAARQNPLDGVIGLLACG